MDESPLAAFLRFQHEAIDNRLIEGLLVKTEQLTIWLILLTIIFVPLERWLALRPSDRTRARTLRDLAYYFFNSIVPAFILTIPAAALIVVTRRLLPDAYIEWIHDLPLWVTLPATFVVGEIGFYWSHRFSHEWPILWQFHVQHHRPTHLDWLINTYAHPVDIIFGRLCSLVPIYFLGLAGHGATGGNLAAVLFTILGISWSFFIHANVRWAPRWLEPIVSTPRFHHWHHVKAGPINRNYASMLPVVDRVFGSLHLPKSRKREEAWPQDYGVKD